MSQPAEFVLFKEMKKNTGKFSAYFFNLPIDNRKTICYIYIVLIDVIQLYSVR